MWQSDSSMRGAKSVTNPEQRKIVRFILVGGFKTAVGYGLYLLLLWFGLHHDVALAGDYLFAITVGYVINRSWTFTNQGRPTAPVLKYVLSYILVFVLNSLALDLAIELGTGPELGQIPCLVLATVASYLLQRYWVFQGPKPTQSSNPESPV